MKQGVRCCVGSQRHAKADRKNLDNSDAMQDPNYLMRSDASKLHGVVVSEHVPNKNP